MSLTMYQASVPLFLQILSCQSALIDKAAQYAAERKIEPSVLLNARLYPDMFSFVRQVQICTDFANRASARLAGVEIPSYADDEAGFGELTARLAKTIAFLKTLKPGQIDGTEGKSLTIPLGKESREFTGKDYLVSFVLPNFLFHAAAAYAILRHNGLDIGKADFMQPPEA